jgi:acyl-CoA thioesterase-1
VHLINFGFLASLILCTNAAFSAPAMPFVRPNDRILIIGDSLTEGLGIEAKKSYPTLLENTLREKLSPQITVINAGISGATSAVGLKQLAWHMRSNEKPTILILALGANDGLRGIKPDVTRKNLREVLQEAQKQGLRLVVAGMKMPPNYGVEYTKEFENTFVTLAKEFNARLVPFLLEGVGAQKEMNLPDGIHPNEKGYEIVAQTVFKVLTEPTK